MQLWRHIASVFHCDDPASNRADGTLRHAHEFPEADVLIYGSQKHAEAQVMIPHISLNTALFLDIDGTLLDLAATPAQVRVPAQLISSLERLTNALDGAFAFVSGRSLDNIDKLFAPFFPAAIGTHGGEIRRVDGLVARVAPLAPSIQALFIELAEKFPGVLLEDKTYTLALHYRRVPESRASLGAAIDAHASLFEKEKVQILHGKAVIEVCPRGIDKGVAVLEMMLQQPFVGRDVLFGGDDTTDESVFRILSQLDGSGFSVGKRVAGAECYFDTPHHVRQWLENITVKPIGVAK